MKTILSSSLTLTLLSAATLPAQSTNVIAYRQPAAGSDGWSTVHADSVGVDAQKLAALTQTMRAWPELGVHAILIERRGRLIYEEYFAGFDERWGTPLGRRTMSQDSLHDLRSITKSVVSALVGNALATGAIRTLDQPVIEWFPEYRDLDTPDRRRVTLRQVMAMTAGFEWNEDIPYSDPRNDEIRMTRDSLPLRYALGRPIVHPPGSEFTYNGGLVQVMAAVLTRATRTSLTDYARTTLWEPLGISHVEWVGNLAGMPAAASGLRMRPRDLAKFGSLYLHEGRWHGKQILPREWVATSTRLHTRLGPPPSPDRDDFGYAHFWWYSCYRTPAGAIEARTAVGNGQQRIYVLPGLDMVVTILAGRYNDFTTGASLANRILREHIIPAVKSDIRTGCPGV